MSESFTNESNKVNIHHISYIVKDYSGRPDAGDNSEEYASLRRLLFL
jgi:hypothetical protein